MCLGSIAVAYLSTVYRLNRQWHSNRHYVTTMVTDNRAMTSSYHRSASQGRPGVCAQSTGSIAQVLLAVVVRLQYQSPVLPLPPVRQLQHRACMPTNNCQTRPVPV